jgi:hypothetical protein
MMSEEDQVELANAFQKIAEAICPPTPPESMTQDASGGYVGSLTEAIMGVTAGLFAIAESIERLSQSIEGIQDD